MICNINRLNSGQEVKLLIQLCIDLSHTHTHTHTHTEIITCYINGQKGGIMTSECIMSLAVIVSSKLSCDMSDGVVLSWFYHWVFMFLEPGVVSCWVSITAAAQSHWTALLYSSRGTWCHRCVFRSIWRSHKNMSKHQFTLMKMEKDLFLSSFFCLKTGWDQRGAVVPGSCIWRSDLD